MVKYDSYKYSGIKSIGDIPSHWEVKHLRNFLRIFSEKGFGSCQLLSVTREKGVILRDRNNTEENHNFVPDDLSGYKHLYAGDFVINKMKSWQGSYGISDYEGIVSPAYFTCKLKGVNPQFFSRALRSKAYIGFFMQFSKGIRVDQWDLDPNSMKDIPFILPPEDEQIRIVSYLDEQCSKIDEAIAQQQKMVDFLNERKQIIIYNAVTKGLNPAEELKDSGIEWIGKIPNSWNLMKLNYIIKVQNGYPFNSNKFSLDSGFPLIRIRDISSGVAETFYTGKYDNEYVVSRGDLLVGMDGDFTVRLWDSDDALLNQRCCRIFNNSIVLYRKYLCYFLPLALKIVNDLTPATTVKHLSDKDIRGLSIPLPSIDEQQSIATFLDRECSQIDNSINSFESIILKLQERKQIITSEVVTGKVRI